MATLNNDFSASQSQVLPCNQSLFEIKILSHGYHSHESIYLISSDLLLVNLDQARAMTVRVSSFAHATEDLDKVVRAIQNMNPQELMGEIHTDRVRGHYGNQIIACHATFAGRSKAERFFNHLWANLSSLDRALLYSRAESQIDKSGTLHLRLGKQEALKGNFVLKDDEPIKIEILFIGWDRRRSITEQVKLRMAEPQ